MGLLLLLVMPREVSGNCKKPIIQGGDINLLKKKHPKLVHQKLLVSRASDKDLQWPFQELRSFEKFENIEFVSDNIEEKDGINGQKTFCYGFYLDGEKCDFSLELDGNRAIELCRRRLIWALMQLQSGSERMKTKQSGSEKETRSSSNCAKPDDESCSDESDSISLYLSDDYDEVMKKEKWLSQWKKAIFSQTKRIKWIPCVSRPV